MSLRSRIVSLPQRKATADQICIFGRKKEGDKPDRRERARVTWKVQDHGESCLV